MFCVWLYSSSSGEFVQCSLICNDIVRFVCFAIVLSCSVLFQFLQLSCMLLCFVNVHRFRLIVFDSLSFLYLVRCVSCCCTLLCSLLLDYLMFVMFFDFPWSSFTCLIIYDCFVLFVVDLWFSLIRLCSFVALSFGAIGDTRATSGLPLPSKFANQQNCLPCYRSGLPEPPWGYNCQPKPFNLSGLARPIFQRQFYTR